MFSKKIKLFFVIIILITILHGCSNKETLKFIDTSITSATLLSEYYDKLIEYTIQTWELDAFNSSLREIDFPEADQEEYRKTIKHLEERKKLVDSFIKVLPLLKDFTENNASTDFKNASIELGNNISEIKPLKDNEIVMPSDIFGNLSEDIILLYKYFEIRHISKTLAKTLEKIKELFEKEKDLYASIIEERNNKSMIVVNYMIDNELVIPWPLIESAPGTVDLDLAVSRKPAKDPKTKEALKKVLEVKYYRMNYLIKSAESDLSILLSDLLKTYDDYLQGKKVVFDNIFYISKRIVDYYTGIDKYVDSIKNRKVYNTEPDITYHGNSDSKIFHQPGCLYYDSKNSNIIFYSRDDAIGEGYTPCNICNP